jgi:hypothetical protein
MVRQARITEPCLKVSEITDTLRFEFSDVSDMLRTIEACAMHSQSCVKNIFKQFHLFCAHFASSKNPVASNRVNEPDPRKRRTLMSRNKLFQFLTVALALAVSIPALASTKNKKDPKPIAKSTFELVGNETLGGKVLKAGEYFVTADESKVSFWRGDKVVAEAPITWQTLFEPTMRNTVVLDSGRIKEIRFAGKTRSLVIQ